MKFSLAITLYVILFRIDLISTSQLNVFNLLFGILRNKTISIIEQSVERTECARDLKIFLRDLSKRKPWALQMFDAIGKYPGGVLAGQNNLLGNFDQCLNVSNDETDPPIIGQYCKVHLRASEKYSSKLIEKLWNPVEFTRSLGFKISNNSFGVMEWMKINHGLCIPHSCSSSNLQDISKRAEHTLKLPLQMTFNDYNCINKTMEIFPFQIDKYIIFFFCMYAALLLMSTCYDMVHKSTDGNDDNLLTAFSIIRNGRDIFSSSKNGNNHLLALNGMKVLQMFWIMIAHRYLFNVVGGVSNATYLHEWKQKVFTSIILSGSYAVDTFLVFSGLLVSYSFLQYNSDDENRPFSFSKIYFLRYLRLTPSLLAMILFSISIFKYLGDGPNWMEVAGKVSIPCLYSWWVSLLFINNYTDDRYMCVVHSWYLSVDSQLFFMSPIILFNLKKRPWKTCLACIVICILSGIYAYIITIRHNLAAFSYEADREYLKKIYYPTPVRMPPWFIGIISGYLIHRYGYIKVNKVNKYMAWIITSILLLGPMYVQLHFNRAEKYSAVKAALFNSCIRQVWGMGIGIFSFLCSTGNGGIVNDFLSLPVFQIIFRLTYGIYLTHVPVMVFLVGKRRQAQYFTSIDGAHQVLGDIPIILIAATFWTLAFESPFRVLGKLLIKRDIINTNKKNKSISEHKSNNSEQNDKKGN